MQVALVMFAGNSERRSFSIAKDITVVGRREGCDLRVPSAEVSRKHCRLIKEADSIRVEDLGSSNGTYVNDERIQEMVLSHGDTLRVGPVTFVVQIGEAAPSEPVKAPLPTPDDEPQVQPEQPQEDTSSPSPQSVPSQAAAQNYNADIEAALDEASPPNDDSLMDMIVDEPGNDEQSGSDDALIDLDQMEEDADG